MTDIVNSFSEWLKEKTSSPMYFLYIFTYSIIHWKFLYILFFEDRILNEKTRLSFALENLPSFFVKFSVLSGFPSICYYLDVIFFSFVAPVVITYIGIIYLPIIYNRSHKVSLEFFIKRKSEYDLQINEYEKRRGALLKEREKVVTQQKVTTQNIAKEKKTQKEIEKTFSNEDTWEFEFQQLKKENLSEFKNLDYLQQVLMSPYVDDNNRIHFVYAQVIGLVNFDRNAADLTNKGKYFVKRYIDSINEF